MRARYTNAAQRYNGLPIERVPNATISVYTAGTTSTPIPDTIYASAVGGTTLANPFAADPTTGVFVFYLDTPKSVKIRQTSPTTTPVEADYETVMPAPEDIMANVSGGVIFLASYANGVDIAGGVASAQTAITAAIADASASGARIVVGPGTYRGIWPATDGLAVEGAGSGATTFLHPDTTNSPVWSSFHKTGTSLSGVTIDGNRSHNNNASTGYTYVEVECAGLLCTFYDVIVENYNNKAFLVDGTDNTWDTCYAHGVADATYAPDTGGSASANAGSPYGFFTGTGSYSLRNRLINCKASGTKLGGIFVGGTDLQIINPQVWDTHRGESLATTTTTAGVVGSGSGGGQIAFTPTTATPGAFPGGSPGTGTLVANGVTLTNPQIGATIGAQATGIELQSIISMEIVAPKVAGASVYGISVLDCQVLTIKGGTLNATSTALWIAGTSRDIGVYGTSFINHVSKAVHVIGSADYLTFSGLRFKTSQVGAVHYTNASSGTHIESAGHTHDNSVVDGGIMPNTFANAITIRSGALTLSSGQLNVTNQAVNAFAGILYNNNAGGAGSTSDGLQVRAGSTAFDTVLSLYQYNLGKLLLSVSGQGQTVINATTAKVLGLDTTAAAGLNAMLQFSRSTTLKWSIGMDASDNPVVLDSAGAVLMTLSSAYTTMSTAPTFTQSGSLAPTVNYARYKVLGKLAHVQVSVTATTGGSAGTAIMVGLPTSTPNLTPAHAGTTAVVGTGIYLDSGTAFRHGIAICRSGALISMTIEGTTDYLGTGAGAAVVPGGAASGDTMVLDLVFELA